MKNHLVKRFKDYYYSPKKVLSRFLKNSQVLEWAIPRAESPEALKKLIEKRLVRIKAGEDKGPIRILFSQHYKLKELSIHQKTDGSFVTEINENPRLGK